MSFSFTGTFAPEGDPISYGLVHPVNSFNTFYLQFFHYVHILKTVWRTRGLLNKMKVVVYGPGWTEGSPRLGDPSGIPEVCGCVCVCCVCVWCVCVCVVCVCVVCACVCVCVVCVYCVCVCVCVFMYVCGCVHVCMQVWVYMHRCMSILVFNKCSGYFVPLHTSQLKCSSNSLK